MPTLEKSRALAESLVSVANGAGLRTGALITDMNEPLASAAGNALEVRNAVDFLTGAHQDPRLREVTLRSVRRGARTHRLRRRCAARPSETPSTPARRPSASRKMVALLGGPPISSSSMDELSAAAADRPRCLRAEAPASCPTIDTRGVGMAVVALGGGRRLPTDSIDHAVGFDRLLRPRRQGRRLRRRSRASMPATKTAAADAERRLIAAYKLGDSAAVASADRRRIDPPKAA